MAHTYAAVDKPKGLCAICANMVYASDERAKTPRNTRYVHLPCCTSQGASSKKARDKTLDEKEADMMLQAISLSLLSLSSDKQRRYESYQGGGGGVRLQPDEQGGGVTGREHGQVGGVTEGSPPPCSSDYKSPLHREFRERGDKLDRGDHGPFSRADKWEDKSKSTLYRADNWEDMSSKSSTPLYRAAVRSHETSAAVAARAAVRSHETSAAVAAAVQGQKLRTLAALCTQTLACALNPKP